MLDLAFLDAGSLETVQFLLERGAGLRRSSRFVNFAKLMIQRFRSGKDRKAPSDAVAAARRSPIGP